MRKNAQRGAAARCQAWLTKVTRNYEVSIKHVTDISRKSVITPAHLSQLSRVSSLLRLSLAVTGLALLPLNVFLQLKQGLVFPSVARCYACPRYLYRSHKQKRLTAVCEVLWAPEVPESCQSRSWTLEAQILKKMLVLSEASWDVPVVRRWGVLPKRPGRWRTRSTTLCVPRQTDLLTYAHWGHKGVGTFALRFKRSRCKRMSCAWQIPWCIIVLSYCCHASNVVSVCCLEV